MIARLGFVLVAVTIVACAPTRTVLPPATGAVPCQTAGLMLAHSLDPNASLAGAFVSNLADVASWEAHAYGTGSLRIVNPSSSGAPLDRVDVCYYDGAFNIGGHPFVPAGGPTFRPYDVLLVTVDAAGTAKIATAGFRESMPIASPLHGP